jgi:creatinine amidohydrolase
MGGLYDRPMPDISSNEAHTGAWRRLAGRKLVLSGVVGLAVALLIAQRPLTAPLPDTVEIADMTWVEVRSAIARGYTTVIVPSGGIEQNGPHMILGKHDRIVQFAAERIAARLGKTLVTPVIPFVPEGDYDPPQGHLRFPGTIGVSEEAYAHVLDGIARSLKAGGFKTICFIADHGGSAKPQAEVATRLSKEWGAQGIRVIDVSDYYADDGQTRFLIGQGETPATIGEHAGITDTSELMAVHPNGVDLTRFADARHALEATGVSGDPMRASAERGRSLIDIKVEAAVRQVRALAGAM